MNARRGREQLSLFDLPTGEKPEQAPVRRKPDPAGPPRRPPGSKRPPSDERGVGKAYLFRVALKWNRKVWRTIEVRGDQTLDDLHLAIQEAFGWDNEHLYSFFMSGKPWDPATEYADPRAEDGRKADTVRIGALRLQPRKRFLYLFDYGDQLLHDVWLAGVAPAVAEVRYPRIVHSHGEAPPQYGALEEPE